MRTLGQSTLALVLVSLAAPGAFGQDADAIARFREALKNPDARVRARAAGAFLVVVDNESAVPVLIEALKDNEEIVCFYAVKAMGKLGPAAKAGVPALVQAFKDEEEEGLALLQTLGQIGPGARDAVAAIRGALESPNPYRRAYAADALAKIDPDCLPLAINTLTEILKHRPSDRAKLYACRALTDLGPRAKSAEGALIEYLKFAPSDRRPDVLRTLAAIGADHEELVPVLIAILKDRNQAASLRTLGKAGATFMAPLVVGRNNPARLGLRSYASILRSQSQGNQLNRRQAAELLAKLGPKAQAAIPALEEARSDPSTDVRKAAEQALGKIRGPGG